MDQSEERWRDMNLVRDETHLDSGRLEYAPEDIIVPIQVLRAAVSQMREAAGARFNRGVQDSCSGISMSKTHFDTERSRQGNRIERSGPFRGHGQQQRPGALDAIALAASLGIKVSLGHT